MEGLPVATFCFSQMRRLARGEWKERGRSGTRFRLVHRLVRRRRTSSPPVFLLFWSLPFILLRQDGRRYRLLPNILFSWLEGYISHILYGLPGMAAVLAVWAGVELKRYIDKKEAKRRFRKSRDAERYEELRAETERRLSGYQAVAGPYPSQGAEDDEEEARRLEQLPSYEQTLAADERRKSLTKPGPGETRRRPNAVKRRGMPADPSLRETLRSFVHRS